MQLVLERGAGMIGGERDAHPDAGYGRPDASRVACRVRASGPIAPVARAERRVLAAEVAAVERRDAAAQAVADDPPGDVGDALGGEAEVLEDRAGRRRGAEVVEPDDRALVADPALPAERHADLDADALADGGRQDRLAVGLVLASNGSQHGSETTRVGDALGLERARPPRSASWSSEPVAIRISAGLRRPDASRRT